MAVSKRLRFEILRRDNHTCRYCGRSAPCVQLTADHVTPTALGGRDEPDNLITACTDCNGGKTSIAPDSPLVADVADDAIRWARAVAVAGTQMLAEHDRRQAVYDEFDQWWAEWGAGRDGGAGEVPRPDDWWATVDMFLAAGLPVPVLKTCVDKALAARKIRNRDVFRYMCGIAWSRIGEIQDAARQIVNGPPDAVADEDGDYDYDPGANLANALLGTLPKIEAERHLDAAREEIGAGAPAGAVAVRAATNAFHRLCADHDAFERSMRHLFRALPSGAMDRCASAAHAKAEKCFGEYYPDAEFWYLVVSDLARKIVLKESADSDGTEGARV